MSAVAWFITLSLWYHEIGGGRDCDFQLAVIFPPCAVFPARGELPKRQFGHQVHVPAVFLLEFASDERVVAQACDFVGIGNRVNVHTVLGQWYGDAALKSVPEQRT